MRWSTQLLASLTNANVVGDHVDGNGAAFDSRLIDNNQLFIAVPSDGVGGTGERFVADAHSRGCRAILVTANSPAIAQASGLAMTSVVVNDVQYALAEIGRYIRQQLPDRVVGITGSVGKTSTKDFSLAALSARFRTHANTANFNNEIGLPTTLLNAPDDVEAIVLEMGMRGFGQIASLCSIASPTVGVITRIAAVHTELVGDIDGVARAKGEIIEALPDHGTAILNADDPRVAASAPKTKANVITYGYNGVVKIASITLDANGYPTINVNSPWGDVTYSLDVMGEHQAHNSVCALAIAGALGVDIAQAAQALQSVKLSKWRMQRIETPSGAIVINDAYNASPASMEAALRTLAGVDAPRKTAFLGRMAELGEHAKQYHRDIAQLASELGVDLIAVETDLYEVQPVTLDQAQQHLAELGIGDAALIKASRSVGLERLV